MGRHGGGSSSGGSHGHSSSSSSSHSSSSGGGSSVRTSTSTPFYGCYNRSYYDRRGHYHTFYTSDRNYGTRSGWSFGIIFALLFITIHMLIMISGFGGTAIDFGGKVKGDSSRIQIVDNTNMLTEQEEKEVNNLFEKIYKKSGMPVALYTTDYEWKNNYIDMVEVYSEVIYYKTFKDENSMIIVFSSEKVGEFLDYLLEHQDSVAFKKLKQLQLFEITTLSAKDNFSFIEKAKIKEILDSSAKQVTF